MSFVDYFEVVQLWEAKGNIDCWKLFIKDIYYSSRIYYSFVVVVVCILKSLLVKEIRVNNSFCSRKKQFQINCIIVLLKFHFVLTMTRDNTNVIKSVTNMQVIQILNNNIAVIYIDFSNLCYKKKGLLCEFQLCHTYLSKYFIANIPQNVLSVYYQNKTVLYSFYWPKMAPKQP